MHKGYLPDCIDHINHCTADNRIDNLRAADNAKNQANRQGMLASRSGVKGVHWHSKNKKWTASVRVNGRLMHLGSFDTVEEAAMARERAAKPLHGEFYNPGLTSECREAIEAAGIRCEVKS